jgi:hypothetical protein
VYGIPRSRLFVIRRARPASQQILTLLHHFVNVNSAAPDDLARCVYAGFLRHRNRFRAGPGTALYKARVFNQSFHLF